jgi:hypothetical protein
MQKPLLAETFQKKNAPTVYMSNIIFLHTDHGISSRGQTTRGGPPAWGLGVGLTTPHRKKQIRYEKDQ